MERKWTMLFKPVYYLSQVLVGGSTLLNVCLNKIGTPNIETSLKFLVIQLCRVSADRAVYASANTRVLYQGSHIKHQKHC